VPGDSYYFRVRTMDAYEFGDWGELQFEMSAAPPAPALTDPANLATDVSLTPTLTWAGIMDPNGDTVTYHWYVDDEATVTAPFTDNNTTAGTTATLGGTLVGFTTYYWMVCADDGWEQPQCSTVWKFTTAAPANQPPVADAGVDQTVVEDTTVTLLGTGTDPDGTIVLYEWDFTSDGTYDTTNTTSGTTTHIYADPGTYIATLRVTDDGGLTDTDSVTITVTEAANLLPVANAGADQEVDVDQAVTLSGSGTDPDGTIVLYEWDFENDGTWDWNSTTTGVTTHTYTSAGTFTARLRVTDNDGATDTDTATYTVNDITAPVADAGPDQTVNSTDTVQFDGSLSTDNVGIVNYTWTFTYDSGPVQLWGATPTFVFVTPGVYDVTLTVTDAASNSDSDTVDITVVDNEDPIADAGLDQMNNDEGTTIDFDGTASTDNVGIVSHRWEFDYEDNTITLDGPSPSFTFTQVGDYVVTLTVMDGEGNFDTDEMTVSIDDSTPPEVVATSPEDGATGVSIETDYVITFSEPMDRAATENAITVDGATIKDFDWSLGDTRLTLTLSGLEHDKEYTVVITGDATDEAGNALDTGTYTFSTQAPPPLFDLANDLYWLIILIILIIVIVILALRKRKAPEATPAVYQPVAYEEAPPVEQYPQEAPYEAPPEEPMEPMPEEAEEAPPPEEFEEPPEEPEE